MTEYLLAVHGNEEEYAKVPESEWPVRFAAVEAFNQRLQAEGVWVFAGGLEVAGTASVIDATGDGGAAAPVITDGPYLETKEHIGGFWVINVPDRETAVKYAADGSAACRGKVEVRPFQSE